MLGLSLKRNSQIPAEEGAVLNWDETIMSGIEPTGDWYVIYQGDEDFVLPPLKIRMETNMILPKDISFLCSRTNCRRRRGDRGQRAVISSKRYSLDNETIYKSPQDAPSAAW